MKTNNSKSNKLTIMLIWGIATAALIYFGAQVISLNDAILSGLQASPEWFMVLESENTEFLFWFAPTFIGVASVTILTVTSFILFRTYNGKGINDKEYSILRNGGIALATAAVAMFTMQSMLFGQFLPEFLSFSPTFSTGDGEIESYLIDSYFSNSWVLAWPIMLIAATTIVLVTVVSRLAFVKDTESNKTDIYTRNALLGFLGIVSFLAPLIIAGQGVWMLDATGMYAYQWQANSFMVTFFGGLIAILLAYGYFVWKQPKAMPSSSSDKNKDVFFLSIMSFIVVSLGIYFFHTFIIANIYTIGVGSLGQKTFNGNTDKLFDRMEEAGISVHGDITMGVSDPYFLTMFWTSMVTPFILVVPVAYRYMFNDKTKLTVDSMDKNVAKVGKEFTKYSTRLQIGGGK